MFKITWEEAERMFNFPLPFLWEESPSTNFTWTHLYLKMFFKIRSCKNTNRTDQLSYTSESSLTVGRPGKTSVFTQEVSQQSQHSGKIAAKTAVITYELEDLHISAFLDVGTGYLSMASTLVCTGRTSPWPTTLHRYVTVTLANSHFARLTVEFASANRSNTACKR